MSLLTYLLKSLSPKLVRVRQMTSLRVSAEQGSVTITIESST